MLLDNWVAEVTSRLLWAEDIPMAQEAFREFAAQANVACYAYGNTRPGLEHPYVESTYPEAWMSHYLANRYQFIDPVVLEAQRSHLPFSWRFLLNREPGLTPAQQILFAEAAEYGIRDGFTIPFHTAEGCIAMLSFVFASQEELREIMAQPRLKLLGLYYHAALERLLDIEAPGDELSPIERQCLTGMAHGHSPGEISHRIRYSEPDVIGALLSARAKLGTATTAQAIAKAITQGLIAP